ncbi:MAG: hypothetical protein HY044_00255 [Candidatus Woesebacteria bacterium]|nr:MAG: hypothetical protein HY044_00255 [Candidatus Woesebacteria bacterium]
MNKEDLIKKVTEILTNMGYTNIDFSNGEENLLIVSFDSKELTSFKADLPGWTYSGIQINNTGKGQYKIEFRKLL